MSETDLYAPILAYLGYRRIPATRHQCGCVHVGPYWINLGADGWSDIIAVLPPRGRALLVEVKPPGEILSPTQLRRIAELEAAGAAAIIVTTVQDLEAALKELR